MPDLTPEYLDALVAKNVPLWIRDTASIANGEQRLNELLALLFEAQVTHTAALAAYQETAKSPAG